jgi:hypothetical protein
LNAALARIAISMFCCDITTQYLAAKAAPLYAIPALLLVAQMARATKRAAPLLVVVRRISGSA